jgi:raffinose/stachyose/melibiose transport system permease protein
MEYKKNKLLPIFSAALKHGLLICILLVIIVPLFSTFFSAFKKPEDIGATFTLMPPDYLYFKNFEIAFFEGKFLNGLKNTVVLVGISLVLNLFLGSMTAYALGRFEFKFRKILMALFMLGMVVPSYITEVSRFQVISYLHLYNTLSGPILIYISADLMQLYIYFQFMDSIPRSLDESAMLDGLSFYGVYRRIILPLILPATAVISIIKAVSIMNDMYIPYLYIPSLRLRTLTTTLMNFSGLKSGQYSVLCAAIILVAIPALIIYFVFQKYIFQGIVAGAVKE